MPITDIPLLKGQQGAGGATLVMSPSGKKKSAVGPSASPGGFLASGSINSGQKLRGRLKLRQICRLTADAGLRNVDVRSEICGLAIDSFAVDFGQKFHPFVQGFVDVGLLFQ